MTQIDVQLDIDAQINAFATAFPIDIIYPNVNYSPTEGSDYIDVSYINGDVFQISPIRASENRSATILQMDIYVDPDSGKYRFKEIIDAMQPYFKRGTVIHHNEIYTRVISFVLTSLVEDTKKSMQIVRVSTRSDYEN